MPKVGMRAQWNSGVFSATSSRPERAAMAKPRVWKILSRREDFCNSQFPKGPGSEPDPHRICRVVPSDASMRANELGQTPRMNLTFVTANFRHAARCARWDKIGKQTAWLAFILFALSVITLPRSPHRM